MKIRIGFVSNSSSASFVIHKAYLIGDQSEKIRAYLANPPDNENEAWDVMENDESFEGSTCMDNEYFSTFLKELNVGMKAVDWRHDG